MTSRQRTAAAVTFALAMITGVAAQRPGRPPEGREFGVRSVAGEPFQATFTSTKVENAVVNGTATPITTTITGTIARDEDGDTYEDVKTPGAGSNPGTERIDIRNLSAMENYVVNVTKQTYFEFMLRTNPKWSGNGNPPGPPHANPNRPTPTQITYTVPDSSYVCAAEEVKDSRTIQPPSGSPGGNTNPSITVTSDQIYCPALHEVLMDTHSDPRFGTDTYQVSGLVTTPAVSFTFTPPQGYTQETPRGPFPGRPRP